MLVSDFMVNSTLKNTRRYFCGMHGMSYLVAMRRRKKDWSCTMRLGRDDQITTSAKLFDVTHGSYGFSGAGSNRDH